MNELFDEALKYVESIKSTGPTDHAEECLVALHDGMYTAVDFESAKVEAVEQFAKMIIAQIKDDKQKIASTGGAVKGHVRSIMLIEEALAEGREP